MKSKQANDTKSSVPKEPPQVTALAIREKALPPEFVALADIQRVSFTPAYLDGITLEQETELCKVGLRVSHSILGPLLVHLKARRRALKLRDWESFCRNTLGYTKQHCDRLIAQEKRIAKLKMSEEGRRQLETEKETKRLAKEERQAARKIQKKTADAKAKQDAEELARRRRNERILEAKPTPQQVQAIVQSLPAPQHVPVTNGFVGLKAPVTPRDIYFFNMGYEEANVRRRGSYNPEEAIEVA